MSDVLTARRLSAALLVAFIAFTTNAGAALLVPGAGLPTPPEAPDGLGAFVAGGVPVGFVGPGVNGYSGTLTATVIQEPPGQNPLGGLTFTYQLHNNATSKTALERINVIDFSGFATDVSFLPATGVAPSVTDRSFGAGAVIGWDFIGVPSGLGTLMPGQTSALMVVQTNAPQYDLTQSASIIDGAIASVPSIGPSINLITPEPMSLSYLAVGAAAFVRRRVK